MKPTDPLNPYTCPKCGTACYWMRQGQDWVPVEADSIDTPAAAANEPDVVGNERDKQGYRQVNTDAGHVVHDPSTCTAEA